MDDSSAVAAPSMPAAGADHDELQSGEDRRAVLHRGAVVGGLLVAGLTAAVAAAGPAAADGEVLVAGTTPPQPLRVEPSAGTATPEGSRVDHVHPTTGLAVVSASNTFLAGAAYTLPLATDVALAVVVGTEPAPRWTAAADGTLSWGPGSAVADVVLLRSGPGALNLVGSLVVRHDAAGIDEPEVVLDGEAAGRARSLQYTTAGVPRWTVEADASPETGANSGSAFAVRSWTDAGTPLRTALRVARDTGDWSILPASSGTSPRMSVGDDATTAGVKLHVKSTLGSALGLQTEVTSGVGPVDVAVAQAATTAGSLSATFGSRLLFQARKGTVVANVAGVAALRDGADNSGALVLQTSAAGALTERLRITSTGNVGIGTATAFGGGKGVLALAFAAATPTTTPVGGGILYTTADGLFWRGSGGTVTKVAAA